MLQMLKPCRCHYLLFIFVWMLFSSSLAMSSPLKVVVFYPQVNQSVFDQVFGEIITGLRSDSALDLYLFPLDKHAEYDEIAAWVKSQKIAAAVALGQASYDIGYRLKALIPVVHGGVMIQPNGHSGVSLVVDPIRFFAELKQLAPHIKRVFTVYSQESNGWMMQLARSAARRQNIELVAYEAENLQSGVRKLRTVLEDVDRESDAVWLLFDRVIPDKVTLPLVLEAAWERRFVVFSNNPSHAKRGALFALFPDYQGMGKGLAKLLMEQLSKKAPPSVVPSSALRVSVNERTASHLGFNFSQNQRAEFDLIYPVQ